MLKELAPPQEEREVQIIDLEPGPPVMPARQFLAVMFGGLFVWWALGVSAFIQDVLAIPLVLVLFTRTRVKAPKIFLWWVLYIIWVGLSGSQVHDLESLGSFSFRAGLYLASTIIFLYIYNAPRKSLPSQYLVNLMALFWVLTTIGGVIGSIIPNFDFKTPFEAILPPEFLRNRFIYNLVHASNASPKSFGGTGIHRPRVPFDYTNTWGSIFSMTLPFAIGSIITLRSRLWRAALIALIVASIFPLVYSFNRGAWLSAGIAIPYALLRMAASHRRRIARFARALLFLGLVVAGVFFASGLAGLVLFRVQAGYSNEGRSYLIQGAFYAANQSPILGWGEPIPATVVGGPELPNSLGTQGQFWGVLVSQGYPGLVFFSAWLGFLLFKSWKMVPETGGRDPTARFWAHIAIVAALPQLGLYDFVPWGILVVMVAAAIALREAKPAFVTAPAPAIPDRPGPVLSGVG